MGTMQIRKAEAKDIPFLIQAIIEADKSNTNRSSYCSLLCISEEEFRWGLSQIFEEELEFCEFGLDAFAVIEVDGVIAAACAGWVEEGAGLPSWQLRMMAIQSVFSSTQIQSFIQNAKIFHSISLSRTKGSLQIESVFISEKFRGLGFLFHLIEFHINFAKEKGIPFQFVELLTYQNNLMAEKAYQKIGFIPVTHSNCDHPLVLSFYPSSGMTQWQKKLQHGQ